MDSFKIKSQKSVLDESTNLMQIYYIEEKQLNNLIKQKKEAGETKESIEEFINEFIYKFNLTNFSKLLHQKIDNVIEYYGPVLTYNPVEEKVEISDMTRVQQDGEEASNIVLLVDNKQDYIHMHEHGMICQCFPSYKEAYRVFDNRVSYIDKLNKKAG